MGSLSALLVALLSSIFAWLVGSQYRVNHRQTHLFWSISLVMSALASLGYCICVGTTPHNVTAFKVYYLFGAMWTPAVMGLGSLALVSSRKTVWWTATVVLILGLVGSVSLCTSRMSLANLTALDGGPGADVIAEGLWTVFVICLSAFGALAVFIVAMISVFQRLRKQQSSRFVSGNIGLAVGILVIAAAGSAAHRWPQLFWITMLVGWIVTLYGYRMLTPQPTSDRGPVQVLEH